MNDNYAVYMYECFCRRRPYTTDKIIFYTQHDTGLLRLLDRNGGIYFYEDADNSIWSCLAENFPDIADRWRYAFTHLFRFKLKERKMSLLDISDLTGIPDSTLSSYKQAVRMPLAVNVMLIAKALQVPSSYFMDIF